MHRNPNKDRGQESLEQLGSGKLRFFSLRGSFNEPLDPTTAHFTHPDIRFGGDDLVVVEVHHLRGTI